ncbi:hypothetical protein DFH06DRAFT_393059 [Mycena polygramma]|nr:hypothetical protein DFH06DRAFT_393059 [Mycena polygramma]
MSGSHPRMPSNEHPRRDAMRTPIILVILSSLPLSSFLHPFWNDTNHLADSVQVCRTGRGGAGLGFDDGFDDGFSIPMLLTCPDILGQIYLDISVNPFAVLVVSVLVRAVGLQSL